MPVDVGDVLDRYELLDELGAGAFGVVYRARHLDLGRQDAIKIPHQPELARQFVTEGRLVSQLDHPNVVRVYAMNMAHDPPFIVYELVDGQSLRERMNEVGGPMDCDEVTEIAHQVLAGLAAAHDIGIIHRDLKPENILIRGDGCAKITDFGLGIAAQQMSMLVSQSMSFGGKDAFASQLGVSRENGSAVGSSVAGTLAYMSPEQEDGLELDGRSDLFALGVLMYEAVTGIRPRGRFRDPKDLNAAIDGCLNDVILRALETQREERYTGAAAMAASLSSTTAAPLGPEPTRASQSVPPSAPVAPNRWELPGTHAGEEIEGPSGIPMVWVPGGS
ncbi:MAG: serine/threonine protein kinase, partial [Chloroflexi bacterium]|nr:serine/threonine protein kinase [Chloroflexota bacterium]